MKNRYRIYGTVMVDLETHRIVDIIDNGVTIYVVMDYIEGESLDKILNEFGAQPEDKVIEWAMQIAGAFVIIGGAMLCEIWQHKKDKQLQK